MSDAKDMYRSNRHCNFDLVSGFFCFGLGAGPGNRAHGRRPVPHGHSAVDRGDVPGL